MPKPAETCDTFIPRWQDSHALGLPLGDARLKSRQTPPASAAAQNLKTAAKRNPLAPSAPLSCRPLHGVVSSARPPARRLLHERYLTIIGRLVGAMFADLDAPLSSVVCSSAGVGQTGPCILLPAC